MNRREFTQRGLQAAALSLMPLNIIDHTSKPDEIIGHGAYRYRVHRNWGDQDPSGVPIINPIIFMSTTTSLKLP